MNETHLHTDLTTALAPVVAFSDRKPRKRETKNLMKRDGLWYFHKTVNGKRLFAGRKTPFSLGTADLVVAKAKRDAILRAGSGAEVDRVLGRTAVKSCTLQDVITAFDAADWPRATTRKKYVRCLKYILRTGTGRAPDLAQTSVSVLTGDLLANYQDAVVARVRAAGHGDLSEEMQVAKYSANRIATMARSVFANEKPFRKLALVRPAGFLEADLFQVKRDLSYQPMPEAECALFAAKSRELRVRALGGALPPDSEAAALEPWQAEGAWLQFVLMRWLGLRNSEVEHCKPAEWLVQTPRGWVLRITNRPYFLPKGIGSVRDLPVADWIRKELTTFAAGREWLLPGATVTDRHEITGYVLNNWMAAVYTAATAAKILPAGTAARTAYDWRKQAGSELYAATKDILQVSKWLGHQSVHTTTKWYVNLLTGLPSLASAAGRPGRAAPSVGARGR